ncbi:hypothetical protein CAP35_10620 [Chitinophagaceae bacterium IBVUCB1]|nr:hypothetical protein CAP35_10620 [Chitinophagaceae bacterium IBVUCB1]
MKQYLTIIAAALTLGYSSVKAQMPYTLTVQNQAYAPLTGATSVNGTKPWTDTSNFSVPIGFNFKMGGKTITRLSLANMATFATDTTGTISGFDFIGTSLIDRGIKGTTSKSPIRYSTTGTAGSRIFKLELFNAGFYDEDATYNTLNDSVNLQVWLYEGTDVVELRYGTSKISNYSDYFFIGGPLVGYSKNVKTESGDFEKIYLLKGNPTVPTIDSVSMPPSMNIPHLSAYPANGTVYRFAPKTTTGIAGVLEADNIKVFPTLCTDKLMVVNKNQQEMQYQIISLSGSVLAKGNIANGYNTLEVSNLPAGMYALTLMDNRGQATYKFAKQ